MAWVIFCERSSGLFTTIFEGRKLHLETCVLNKWIAFAMCFTVNKLATQTLLKLIAFHENCDRFNNFF